MKLKIDILKENYQAIKIKQNTNVTFTIELYNDGKTYDVTGKTIALHCVNSNKNVLIQGDNIIVNGNILTIKLMKDMTYIAGNMQLQIEIGYNSELEASFKIPFVVDERVNKMGNLVPSLVVDVMTSLSQKITEALGVKVATEELIKSGGAVAGTETAHIEGVTVTKKRDDVSGTSYWLTYIPHKDKDGNINKINVGCSEYYENNPMTHNDDGFGLDYENNPKLERARDFAKRKNASVVINGGIWGNTGAIGDVIIDGVIKASSNNGFWSLGVADDNTFKFFAPTITAQQMLDLGYKNVISAFIPVVINGEQPSDGIYNLYSGGNVPNPRQAIGQMPNKDIYIISTDGRDLSQNGMTMRDLTRLFLELGVENAYNLDGGGSVSTVINGVYRNRPIDDNGFVERKCCNFIYWEKDYKSNVSQSVVNTGFTLGDIKKMVDDVKRKLFYKTDFEQGWCRLRGDVGYEHQGIESWDGENKNAKLLLHKDYIRYWDYNRGKAILDVQDRLIVKDGNIETSKGVLADIFGNNGLTTEDINAFMKTTLTWVSSETPNAPGNISYALFHIQNGSISAIQIAYPFSETATIKQRIRKADGSWSVWR